jgi:hypothetical protein
MFVPHRKHAYVSPRPVTWGGREREKKLVVRDTTMGLEKDKKNLSSVLKVPSQCSLILPVGAKHSTGLL